MWFPIAFFDDQGVDGVSVFYSSSSLRNTNRVFLFCLWFTRALINHGALKQDAWHSPILTSLNSIDRHLLADGLKPSSLHFPESTLHLRLKIIARIPMAFNRPTKFVRVDEGKIWPENLSQNVPYCLVSPPIGVIPIGWWFGTWLLWLSIELGTSSSQLTKSYFAEE